ncbi:hypothetical protein TKK_0001949 [Trichogramma kaykai]|uniref:Uncharacterized protein n=1 Tax=Trichogramma kaykai TaxID=54128 RepID=A0ABD2X8P0_9HYME
MKFLRNCSQCLDDEEQATNCRTYPSDDPLVMTKRPRQQQHRVVHPKPQKSNFLSNFNLWPRRKSSQKAQTVKIRAIRVIEPPPPRRRLKHRPPPSRTQRLINMYEERAHSPDPSGCIQRYQEYLLDPPASFSGEDSLESHQNFRNKLNTLDFQRMNTVALEAEPSCSGKSDPAIYHKNSYNEESSTAKFARKTMLEDFLKERPKIEQTMIDLFNGKSSRTKSEERKVRFQVDAGAASAASTTESEQHKGKTERETEIKLQVDPTTKVRDFYVEKRTTYLKHKTVEDKALVLKIAPRSPCDDDDDDDDAGREMVFKNFGKMSL